MGLGLSFLLLVIGLILLWKTGEWSVNNAVRFSVVYRIESFIIGFFIFAVATGLPEITSAAVSSFKKVPELSAGNLVGSTFVNLSLQLGIASILAEKLPVQLLLRNRLLQSSITVTIIMTILFFLPKGNIYLGIGLIAIYLLSFIRLPQAPKEHFSQEVKKELVEQYGTLSPKAEVFFKLTGSLCLLVVSAWLTVISAVSIAQQINVPVALIGGTLIAVGTALPELTLEIHAVRRKEYGLALGDIFGSSLLNLSFILGMLNLFNPGLPFVIPRLVFPFFIPVMLWIFYRLFRKEPFTRYDGIAFILLFLFYMIRVSAGHLLS